MTLVIGEERYTRAAYYIIIILQYYTLSAVLPSARARVSARPSTERVVLRVVADDRCAWAVCAAYVYEAGV